MSNITVIICTYNECKTVQKCIKSVLDSDNRINEVIVIDDCSKDHTKAQVIKLNDSRVHFYTKNHNKHFRGKNDSLYIGAHLASNENLFCIDCDTIVYSSSDLINKLEDGYDLVGAIISVIPGESILSKCESIEYNIAINRARPWLYNKFGYLNNVSGAGFGIKRSHIIKNRIPNTVTGEDFYYTQIGIINNWRIALSNSVVSTYATPSLKALFIQRCRWVSGFYSVISATGRKVPLIELITTYYRTLSVILFLASGMVVTHMYIVLSLIVLALYFINEYYHVRNIKYTLYMMTYRQISFLSSILFMKYGKTWKVIR